MDELHFSIIIWFVIYFEINNCERFQNFIRSYTIIPKTIMNFLTFFPYSCSKNLLLLDDFKFILILLHLTNYLLSEDNWCSWFIQNVLNFIIIKIILVMNTTYKLNLQYNERMHRVKYYNQTLFNFLLNLITIWRNCEIICIILLPFNKHFTYKNMFLNTIYIFNCIFFKHQFWTGRTIKYFKHVLKLTCVFIKVNK